MQRILVTGGSGFIGTNLLKTITGNFSNIVSNYYRNETFFKVDGVKYLKADLENINECKEICSDIDTVVMCAANSSGAEVMEKTPLVHLTPNIRMNLNMLEAAYETKVKKFIFISSNTVYPHVDFPVKEEDSKYSFFEKYHIVGWMKKFSEEVCEIYSKKIKDKMKTIIVRPGNLFGPHDKFDPQKSKVIPSLIKKVVEKQNPINVWGDGEDLKDFLYIDDFIDALVKIIVDVDEFEILNIASGKGITIKEVLKKIIEIEKANNLDIEFDISKPTMIPKRLINIDKAKKIINFNPKVDIYNGLEKTIKWYKENDNFTNSI